MAVIVRGQQRRYFLDELAGARVQVAEHGPEPGHGERGTEFGPDGFPTVAGQVDQVLEQLVVHERFAVDHSVVERPELRGQYRVHQFRFADHQHGVPQLVHAEVPAVAEVPVQRVDGRGGRPVAQRGPGEMAQQRHGFRVRHAQPFPVSVMARAVFVRQPRDDRDDRDGARHEFRQKRSPTAHIDNTIKLDHRVIVPSSVRVFFSFGNYKKILLFKRFVHI